jgi:hypothetical protein
MDEPLGGTAYHERHLRQHERWLAYTRRRKLQLGIEAHRLPGLNSWVTQQRALQTAPKVNGDHATVRFT